MNFLKTENNESVHRMRTELYQTLTAPIDAMWELLYIASSQHLLIQDEDKTIGFCCVNAEGALIQIYVEKEYRAKMSDVIQNLIIANLIRSASLSSNEPIGFNACLSLSKSKEANTICFQHQNKTMMTNSNHDVELVSEKDIPEIKFFLKKQIGMDDTFGYTENLVTRKEIYMIKKQGTLIATSEYRISDTQPGVSDLGIIVNKDYQGQGIATQVLQLQVNSVLKAGRSPICSTTSNNIGARKAIEKAGFYCSNIIFDFQLHTN